MSLDLRTLYPNFHAETTRHPSSSPRPSSGKGTNRKKPKNDLSVAPSRSRTGSHLPRTGLPSQHPRLTSVTNPSTSNKALRAMPPLHGMSYGSRPSTPADGENTPRDPLELSFVGSQPTRVQTSTPESLPIETIPILGKTRKHVLRGDLALDAFPNTLNNNNQLTNRPRSVAERAPSRLLRSSSLMLLPNSQPLDEMVQCSARPRSRYARREIATPIQPLTHRHAQSESSLQSARGHLVDSSASRPSSSSANTPLITKGVALRGSQSTGTIHPVSKREQTAPLQPPTMLSWTEQDAASFFLTEIDAQEVADQWAIAHALARGAHFVYALHDYERGVSCFADALTLAQQHEQPSDHHKAIEALAHHHMGIAFHEDGQAKWALMMQKKALELAQQCNDHKLEARALKALGVLFLDRDEPQRALDCQQQALTLAHETKDLELEARVYANLGNLAAAQRQFHHAISCHERDLAASGPMQLDSAVGQARAYRNLALIYAKLDQKETQLEHELHAARLEASNAFETDMRRHARDVVGNIYLQLTRPDTTMMEMVASSVQDLLTAREEDEHTTEKPLSSRQMCIT